MAKNKDGLEAGKPVSAEDFKRVHNAHKNGKPSETKPKAAKPKVNPKPKAAKDGDKTK